MDIRIKTTEFDMAPETSDYLDERIQALEKLLGDDAGIARCEVEVGRATNHQKQGKVWFAEINLLHGGQRLRALAHAETVNAAIDEAKDEMIRQLRKGKESRRSFLKRGGELAKRMLHLDGDTA